MKYGNPAIYEKTYDLVRTAKGRLVPVKGAAQLLGQSLELWESAFGSFDELGPYLTGRGGSSSPFGGMLAEALSVIWVALRRLPW